MSRPFRLFPFSPFRPFALSPFRPFALSPFCLLSLLLLTACVPRYERAVLPPDVTGPAPVIREEHATPIDAERVRLTKEYLEIHNPPLAATLPTEDTPEAISFTPRMVLVHFTAIPTLEKTLEAFEPTTIGSYRETIRKHGLLNVGIHFVVDRDGTIYRLYPETVISRHVIGLNHVAIGIENVGMADLGSRTGEVPLTEAQLDANVRLVRYLAGKYPTLHYVVAHSEYTDLEDPDHPAHDLFYEELPEYRTEKTDPGRRFMRRLRQALR